MAKAYKYPQTVAIITDDLLNATKVAKKIANIFSVEVFAWPEFKETQLRGFDFPIFDVDIGVGKNVARLKKIQEKNKNSANAIFSFDRRNHGVVAQANALGVAHDVKRPLNSEQLTNVLISLCNTKSVMKVIGDKENTPEKKSKDACLAISDLMDGFVLSVRKGGILPVEEMHESINHIIDAVGNLDIKRWFKAVRPHSSYTYRHVMIVSGYAAAFCNTYNLPYAEKERLILGALVHDIGKLKTPEKILDKPSKLTPEEYERVKRHPQDGAAILRKDSRISDEIVSIALNHHEYLDGSGYPNGLKADEISDIVRLMTVIDIFSALLETRSYKKSLTSHEAYATLVKMGDKLDQDIVRAFEPVALCQGTHRLVQRINGTAA